MDFPINKYKFVTHNHPIHGGVEYIAISSYAGKAVRGKAICHEDDTYSEERGKQLAAARCGAKIADKRAKRAEKCFAYAQQELEKAQKMYNKMKCYRDDAHNAAQDAHNAVAFLLNEI